MAIIRAAIIVGSIVGAAILQNDWESLPNIFPTSLGRLPVSLFSFHGLVTVILSVGYILSEYKNIRRQLDHRWIDADNAAGYFRHLLQVCDDQFLAAMIDAMGTTGSDAKDLSIRYVLRGVRTGDIRLRGRLENGIATVDVPQPIKEHSYSEVHRRSPRAAQVGADDCVYVDLSFNRSDIKKWTRRIAKEGNAEMNVIAKD